MIAGYNNRLAGGVGARAPAGGAADKTRAA